MKPTLVTDVEEVRSPNTSRGGKSNSYSGRDFSGLPEMRRSVSTLLEMAKREMSSRGGSTTSLLLDESHFDGTRSSFQRFVGTVSTFTIATVWLINVFGAFMCMVLAEVYKKKHDEFPLLLTVTIGNVMFVVACLLVFVEGKKRFGRSYKFYQPFVGGQAFVMRKFLAYLNVTTSLLGSFGYIGLLGKQNLHDGALVVFGALGVGGCIMAMLSIRHFDIRTTEWYRKRVTKYLSKRKITRPESNIMDWLGQSPNAETTLSALFIFAQCVLGIIGIIFPPLQFQVTRLTMLVQLVNMYVMHVLIGCRHVGWYNLIAIRLERLTDTVLMWVLRFFYAGSIILDGMLATNPQHISPAMMTTVLLFNVVTASVCLMFLRTTDFTVPTTQQRPETYGGIVITSIAVVVCVISISIQFYFQWFTKERVVTEESLRWRTGVMVLLMSIQCFGLLLTPIAQSIGKAVYGDRVSIFGRFQRSVTFVLLQGLSCFLFTLSVLSFTLFLATRDLAASGVTAFFSLSSVITTCFALRHFSHTTPADSVTPTDSGLYPPETQEGGVSPSPSDLTDEDDDAEDERVLQQVKRMSHLQLTYLLNGELILSFVLAFVSLVLHVLIDLARNNFWGEVEYPTRYMHIASGILFLVATPLAHISGRDKGIHVFKPLYGSEPFIALQVLGWASYAIFLVSMLIGVIVVSRDSVPFTTTQSFERYSTWASLVGTLQLLPVVLITLSIVVESPRMLNMARQRELVMDSVNNLKQCLKRGLEGRTLQEWKMTEIAFRTTMESTLQYFDVPYSARMLSLVSKQFGKHPYPFAADGLSFAATTSSDDDDDDEVEGEEDFVSLNRLAKQKQAVWVMMILLSCASASAFMVAFFLRQFIVLALALTVCGLAVTTVSCMGIHIGYGLLLHGKTGAYTVVMPFRGGSRFISLQIVGWGTYAGTSLVTLWAAVEETGASGAALVLAAVLSVLSQVFIFRSVPTFSASLSQPSFLEENGEGIIALLAFLGAFFVRFVFEPVSAFFFSIGWTSAQVARLPFVIIVLLHLMAVPLIMTALARTSRRWESVVRYRDRSRKHQPQEAADAVPATSLIVHNVLEIITATFGSLLPIGSVFLVYYFSQIYTPLQNSLRYYWPVFGTMVLATVLLSVVPYIAEHGLPSAVVSLRRAVITCMIYGLPVLGGIVAFGPLAILPRLSTRYFAFSFVSLTLFAAFRQFRFFLKMAGFAVIGVRAYSVIVCVPGLVTQRPVSTVVLQGDLWSTIFGFLVDVALVMVVVLYLPRYKGRPHFTGAARNNEFTNFFRRYIYPNLTEYFNFSIIVDEPGTVNMRDPKNQYLFSFHPHGVFPATAMLAALSSEWHEKVGANKETYVSTHAASIIFNVPMIRDFNLRQGVLDVSRKGIEGSLGRGNSVLIVTGGQAEMLHTRISDQKMVLVTHHKGFVRLAIRNRVPLVPAISIGENGVFGMMEFSRLHKYTLKYMGFPFPLIFYGRFGLPIPISTPLTLVVGKPVPIPDDASDTNEDDVNDLLKKYFTNVKEVFYKYRADAGYPEMELILVNRAGTPIEIEDIGKDTRKKVGKEKPAATAAETLAK